MKKMDVLFMSDDVAKCQYYIKIHNSKIPSARKWNWHITLHIIEKCKNVVFIHINLSTVFNLMNSIGFATESNSDWFGIKKKLRNNN